jgi:NADH-quinone oxidoreductase subunit M
MSPATVLMMGLLAIPALAALVVAALGPNRGPLVRWVALTAVSLDLLLAAFVCLTFLEIRIGIHDDPVAKKTYVPELVPGSTEKDPHNTTWPLLEIGGKTVAKFHFGVDGLNVWLVVLTAFLMVSAVLISWNAVQERVNEYYAWLLALGAGMLGVFLAFDILLFYIFFELTLVPLFFLIGIWGGAERRYAARKFFVFTLTGSLITFLGLLAIVLAVYLKSTPQVLTFSIPELVERMGPMLATDPVFWKSFQIWVFLALFAGFAIKVPLFPLHTWLPLAHVEAPTAGSVLLAGVLLKMGTYGFLRLTLPLTPDACITLGVPLIGTLSVIGILYGAFCSLAQDDIKKMIAYSSVSHLGFCMLGMFALNQAGLEGSILQMINHGLSTGGLFLVIGMLYERYHTRKMADYSGIGSKLGLLSFAMVVICLSSVGLPGLNGFVGETLVFFGMTKTNPVLSFLGTGGILLGAWYLLTMLKNVFFGPLKEPGDHGHGEHPAVRDLDGREIVILAPILVLCLLLGVFPQPVIDASRPDLTVITNILDGRKEALAKMAPAAPATKVAAR